MAGLSPATAYSRDALIERATEADTVSDLFATASERLHRLVDFDASVWLATDPTTALPSVPSTPRTSRREFARG